MEAAYRLSVPRTTWLEGLGRAAEDAFGQGRGTVAVLVDATDSHDPRVIDYASTRSITGLDRMITHAFASLEPAYVEGSKRPRGSFATEADGMDQPGIRMWLEAFGARDMLTFVAMDPSGVGAVVAINLAETSSFAARESTVFAQLSAHVLGAYHLRERSPVTDDAIFRTNGDVVSVGAEVREAGVLADLTNAVRALGALRDARSNEGRALDKFTSRVDATWSVVAQVDDGADQWVVAKRNPPSLLALPDTLSQRETQVMSLLLLGRTPKLVAYELGIAHSTVRVLVSRALVKLRAKTVKQVRARFAVAS